MNKSRCYFIGDGSSKSFVYKHNLQTEDFVFNMRRHKDNTSGHIIGVRCIDDNTVEVAFPEPPPLGEKYTFTIAG